jgi:Salmonella virulence plasmid 65kDa B protein
MANKSNPATQIISTPQGGGALHGIGETFSPDLHTGNGNGNGPFGLGWSLSIPGVSRKTSRGIPRYDDDHDTFLFSGAEDLVPVAKRDGVIGYRPRTEGLFVRIEHRRDLDTDHWEVRSKDGLVSVYGTPRSIQNDPAVIANPENRNQIFNWKLTETKDSLAYRGVLT